MLRIRYEGRETVFEFRGIKKADAAEVINNHLALWRRERVIVDGQPVTREIPVAGTIAEWQDGDGIWDAAKPCETIPVPGA